MIQAWIPRIGARTAHVRGQPRQQHHLGAVGSLIEHDEIRWLGPDELDEVDWARADRPVLPALRELLKESAPTSE